MLVSLFIRVSSLCCVLHGTPCIRAIHFLIYENSCTLVKVIFFPSVQKQYCLTQLEYTGTLWETGIVIGRTNNQHHIKGCLQIS